jgi:hypothetical protein
MNMKRMVLLAGAACALVACSPPGPATIQPGHYRTTATVVSITMPGAPPEQVQAMQAMQGQPVNSEQCITPADVDNLATKGFGEGESNCSQNHVTVANGHIEGNAACSDAMGQNYSMQVTGSFTATHIEMDMTMSGQSPMGQIAEHMRMTADRTGDCPANGATTP